LVVFHSTLLFSESKLLVNMLVPVWVVLTRMSTFLLSDQNGMRNTFVSSFSIRVVDVVIAVSVNHVNRNGFRNLLKWDFVFVVLQIDKHCVPALWVQWTHRHKSRQNFWQVSHSWVLDLLCSNSISFCLSVCIFLLVVRSHEITRNCGSCKSWSKL